VSDNEGQQNVPPPGGQYPPNWGSAYPPPGGQYPPPPPGQAPPSGQPYYYPPQIPKHPQATTAMILGILGLVLCGVIGPFAWVMGSKAVKEIDANPNAYSGRGEANAGKIMGIISTAIMAFLVGCVIILLVIGLAVGSTASSTFDSGMPAF
jgi:hypothetical protein